MGEIEDFCGLSPPKSKLHTNEKKRFCSRIAVGFEIDLEHCQFFFWVRKMTE